MGSEAYSADEKQAIATVAASSYRERVLRALDEDGPSTPTELHEQTGIASAHVSRALGDLRDVGCVELLVPEGTRKGKIHDTTDRAEPVLGVVGDE